MTTKPKVDLYIATNLEELNKRTEDTTSLQKAKSQTCAQITHVIESTIVEAKKAELTLDEERAYVLYMRLFSCFKALKETKDIASNHSSVRYYQKGALIWFDKASQLSESLKARYEEVTASKLEEERKAQAELDEEKSLQKSITPRLLYKYLTARKKTFLLIDMRLKNDYDQSHMKTADCIHIPADLMNGKGWTSWNVESALTNADALTNFRQRASFDYIILFDEGSYETDLKAGNCLMGLKQAIFFYDQDVKLKHEPLIIQGGYEDWMISYPGQSTAPLISKKTTAGLRSFEVSYPDDVLVPEQTPSDAATTVQPEAVTIPPVVLPQVDRTRKPINNQKPESPTTESPGEEQSVPAPPEIPTKEQPEIPNRSTKPIPSSRPSEPVEQEPASILTIPNVPLRPSSITPILPSSIPQGPKAIDINENKINSNLENIPPKDPSKFTSVNRENLSIYRPFNRSISINDTNDQYQKKFDAVTGRKLILDTKNNRYVPNVPENDSSKSVQPVLPPVNRESKPVLTEQARQQLASDYRAMSSQMQINRRTGLKNLGNSCYINSIIQSLSFNSQLTNYFLSGEFKRHINSENKFGSGGIVVNEWFSLIYLLWCQQYTYLAPLPFKYTVGKLQRAYLGTQQQDAHEFLVFLLDALHEDLNKATRPRIEELKSENYKTDQQFAEASKKAFGLHNQSIIIDLFYGLFKSITICCSCSYNSIRFEAFTIISVPIPLVRQCSLDDCLDLFRDFEHLKGDERYQCSKCQRLTEKKRRLDIWELPKIFIVHFKRFRLQQNHYIKNETLIHYPISHVNFSRWSQTRSSSAYSLVSIVNHNGSMNSGHYTSYCNDGQQWYYCDDQSIRAADTRELEQNVHAYLLFYSSIPPQQLRLPLISN